MTKKTKRVNIRARACLLYATDHSHGTLVGTRRRRFRSQNMRSEQLCVWVAQEGGWALEQQSSGDTKAPSVVARNGGYRGWRHEEAVAMQRQRAEESARRSNPFS